MTELRVAFRWWTPEGGFRWVEGGDPVFESQRFAFDWGMDGEAPVEPPWLVGAPLEDEEAGERRYDFRKKGRGLHREFTAVTLDCEAILRFANAWGRLTRSGTLVVREESGDHPQRYRAEAVAFWRRAIQDMRDAVLLWDLLRADDEVSLRKLIVWRGDEVSFHPPGEALWAHYTRLLEWQDFASQAFRRGDRERGRKNERKASAERKRLVQLLEEGDRAHYGPRIIARPGFEDQLLPLWQKSGDVMSPARALLSRMVNDRLRGSVNLGVASHIPDDEFSTSLTPKDLLSALWLEFFFEVIGRRKLRPCPICRTWFDARRSPRRVFCDRFGSGCRQKAARLRKSARTSENQGLPPERIAEELGVGRALVEFLLDEKDAQEEEMSK